MTKMKAAFATGGAGIAAVTIGEMAVPEAAPGQALVRLRAATLNFRDLLGVRGLMPVSDTGYVPLSCGMGEVVAVGEGVTRVTAGDRVSPLFSQGWLSGPHPAMAMLGGPVDGVAREYAALDAESLCLIPDEIGDMEAATLPCAGLTAWSAVFGPRPVRAGDTVLVQGTGGVALAALQWAKAAGATVIVTSSADAKLARARALGGDILINYRTVPDWPAAARAALGGRGVDVVVDLVGLKDLADCARAVAADGVIASVGRLEGEASWGHEVAARMVPIVVGNREQHEAMLAFAAAHGIRPVVDIVYGLDRLPDALRRLEAGAHFGKIGINLL